jgi:ABC-type multidrug transport system fused ATPase/permease subunit
VPDRAGWEDGRVPTRTRRSRALAALLRPDAGRWLALAALVAAASGLALAGPLVVRRIVDRAGAGAGAGELRMLAVGLLAIVVVAQGVAVLVARAATVTAWRTTNELRLRITRHVLGLDHEFHRRHTPGELIQRVDGDVTSVSQFLGQVVPKALGALLLVAGMIAVLSVLDWRVGVGMTVYVAIALGVVLLTRHRSIAESSDEMGSYARLYGGIEERLNAAEDLRSAGAGAHAMWRFVEDSAGALASSVRRERAFLVMWWAVQMSVAAGIVVAVTSSAVLVSRDVISLGTAFLLFQYVLLISRPLEEVVHELETVQKANGAMVRVIDLLGVEPSIVDRGRTSPPPGPLEVRFRAVSFDYGDDQSVLRDVDLDVAPGRSVGIVGRTGSGKTTFSRLVLRLVEATDGTVALGGVPIGEIPLTELRRRVALVPQEVELFAGTVRENVTLFDPDPSDAAVGSALRAVGLDSLVDGGIDRPLGAGGAGLSAGEAQLLAMARVWLRDPDLVVLDEATARVDPETEARLVTAVRELMRGRTTLVIAHRLSTLREVDEIAVFERGRIVEHGDRADLAADPATRYHRLLDLALESGGEGLVDDADADGAAEEQEVGR